VSGCTTTTSERSASTAAAGRPSRNGGTVLLAYFSRAGENYYNGGRRRLAVGNTQVVAAMIGRLVGCDVHRIEAADPYPTTTTRPSNATSGNRTPTPGRPSRTR
jgi:hypothetical protein